MVLVHALHVAIARRIAKLSSYPQLPASWPRPRYWFGQSVCMAANCANRGIVTGCEWMPSDQADKNGCESGWWYTVIADRSSPCYQLEPQFMIPESDLIAVVWSQHPQHRPRKIHTIAQK